MAQPRRMGTETSETRHRLLDVTERLMLAEGYAAVSSRSVAKAAEVTPALVHYYFATIDDLFLEVLRRRAEQQLERQQLLLAEGAPLRAFWDWTRDPKRTALVLEFMSLANHRKAIQEKLGEYTEQFRRMQLAVLEASLKKSGRTLPVEPIAMLGMINAVASNLVLEKSIGVRLGHREIEAAVQFVLDSVEPTGKLAKKPPKSR